MRGGRIKQERRRYPRWGAGGRIFAQLTPLHDAVVLNFSPGGALVEHVTRVQPGSTLLFSLSLVDNHANNGKKMVLKCRVVRSIAHRCEVRSNGERDVIYRSGLEFLGTLQPLGSLGAAIR